MIDKMNPLYFKGVGPIPVIPTVYTDALSYGEQLGIIGHKADECVDKVNEIIEDNETFKAEMNEQEDEFKGEMQNQYDEFLEDYQRAFGVTQVRGTSITDVMSQKAVTDNLVGVENDINAKYDLLNTMIDEKISKPNVVDNGKLPVAYNGNVLWQNYGMPTPEQVEVAVNAWLDEHPEATTTVEDRSLTWEKMVVGTLGYVTPQMFGAVADGISDDTDAIIACNAKAVELGVPMYLIGNFYTTEDCVLNPVGSIVQYGSISYLDLNAKGNTISKTKLDTVTTLIMRNYKSSEITVNNSTNMSLIADTRLEESNYSNTAYCTFFGGLILNFTIDSKTPSSWINENVFVHTRFKHITIQGEYNNNNNRFYDVCVENGGSITLKHAVSNYFRIRGEGGYLFDADSLSYNNIVETTYNISNKLDYANGQSVAVNGNIQTNMWWKYLRERTLFESNCYNTWNNNNNYTTKETNANQWAYVIAPETPIIAEIKNDTIFKVISDKAYWRPQITLYDASMNIIEDNMLASGNLIGASLTFDASNHSYKYGVGVNNVTFSVLPNSSIKYIEINMFASVGGAYKYVKILSYCVDEVGLITSKNNSEPVSANVPSSDYAVAIPTGLFVRNIGTSAVLGWRFNGASWDAIS